MDGFNKFRDSLNQRPKNTRSSAIDSERNSDSFEETCPMLSIGQTYLQARYIDPEYNDSQSVTARRNTDVQRINTSESQNILKQPSDQLFQRTNLSGINNTSGKPFDLSEFRNNMDSDPLVDNEISSIRKSTAWFSQRDSSSNVPDVPRYEHGPSQYEFSIPSIPTRKEVHRNDLFKTYDDSGRTFNLGEWELNVSQPTGHLNDVPGQTFDRSRNEQTRTGTVDSRKSHCNKCECLGFSGGCESHQTSKFQCKPNGNPKSTPNIQPVSKTKRNPLHETLVKDSYYPGIIVKAVNGLIDFNQIAFDAVFDCQEVPQELEQEAVPMSLLEAFDLRIQYEKGVQEDSEGRNSFCLNEMKKENSKRTKTDQTLEEDTDESSKEAPEYVKYRTHRDELKLASTIDIDLISKVGHYPTTPLTEAIKCLFKAEKMNGFDKNVHLAEEAIKLSSNGQHELAALKSTCSFKLNLHKEETKTPKTSTYEPLAIISYIGTTKPNN